VVAPGEGEVTGSVGRLDGAGEAASILLEFLSIGKVSGKCVAKLKLVMTIDAR